VAKLIRTWGSPAFANLFVLLKFVRHASDDLSVLEDFAVSAEDSLAGHEIALCAWRAYSWLRAAWHARPFFSELFLSREKTERKTLNGCLRVGAEREEWATRRSRSRNLCGGRERNFEIARPGLDAGVMQVQFNLQSPAGTECERPAVLPGDGMQRVLALGTNVKKQIHTTSNSFGRRLGFCFAGVNLESSRGFD